MISAPDALRNLRDGNRRFVAGDTATARSAGPSHAASQSAEQNPFAIILACSDSRVPVELVFDQGCGDVFVIRIAGNVVTSSGIGSIEYAVNQFGTRLVVALGHSNCGAVVATIRELLREQTHRSPNLRAIVDRIRPAIEPILQTHASNDMDALTDAAVCANIRASVERLTHGSVILERLIDEGVLTIVGAEYSLETGNVEFFGDRLK